MMIEYVAGFLFNPALSSVVLVRKARPQWQAGKLNGVGGRIESGEPPEQAMVREFQEETGLHVNRWKKFATLTDNVRFVVHWFWAFAADNEEVATVTDEPIDWYSVSYIVNGDYRSVPNVKWLLCMAKNDALKQDSCSLFTLIEHHAE